MLRVSSVTVSGGLFCSFEWAILLCFFVCLEIFCWKKFFNLFFLKSHLLQSLHWHGKLYKLSSSWIQRSVQGKGLRASQISSANHLLWPVFRCASSSVLQLLQVSSFSRLSSYLLRRCLHVLLYSSAYNLLPLVVHRASVFRHHSTHHFLLWLPTAISCLSFGSGRTDTSSLRRPQVRQNGVNNLHILSFLHNGGNQELSLLLLVSLNRQGMDKWKYHELYYHFECGSFLIKSSFGCFQNSLKVILLNL